MSVGYLPRVRPKTSLLQHGYEFHGDTYLHYTPGSAASDKQHGSVSAWFRRARLDGTRQYLVTARYSASPQRSFQFNIEPGNTVVMYCEDSGGSALMVLESTETVTDLDWHHLFGVYDFDNPTQAERGKLYLDGAEITYGTSTRPAGTSSDLEGLFWDGEHNIGRWPGGTSYFKGIIADVNLVNGQVLTPSDFGETVDSAWVWKNYTGTHGTNGARFEFKTANAGENTAQA